MCNLQNKALRERLHAAQAAAEENARLKHDMQQLRQQMVRRRPAAHTQPGGSQHCLAG